MSRVPIISLSSPSKQSIDDLDDACREHGFFLLSDHGADELIDEMWRQTKRFFDSGPDVKEPLRRTEDNSWGYYDRETTKQKRDRKEVFDFLDPATPASDARNRWPENLPGFRAVLAAFHAEFATISDRTNALLHQVLGLGPESQEYMSVDRRNSPVRLNHYPVGDPVAADEQADIAELGDVALGHHTDPGSITLLLQDDVGGLQTQGLGGEWIDVPPEPGTIVVNLADAVQVQTNDRWRAAVHRVVPMTASRRFSIPFFGSPASDAVIAPLVELAETPHYRGFTWDEFMSARIADSYGDVGAADAQISDYRINS